MNPSIPVAVGDDYTPPSLFDGTVAPQLVHTLQTLIDEYGWTGVSETLKQMTDGALLTYMGTDAGRWAAQFVRLHPNGTDEGTLIGWFANAIEAGREAGRTDR
jgi:hypothetical protein